MFSFKKGLVCVLTADAVRSVLFLSCAFTLYPFRPLILLPVCHCLLPVSSPLCFLVPAMCSSVYSCLVFLLFCVPVSPPPSHLFPIISLFVSLICFSCILLIPLVKFTCLVICFPLLVFKLSLSCVSRGFISLSMVRESVSCFLYACPYSFAALLPCFDVFLLGPFFMDS